VNHKHETSLAIMTFRVFDDDGGTPPLRLGLVRATPTTESTAAPVILFVLLSLSKDRESSRNAVLETSFGKFDERSGRDPETHDSKYYYA
jgi:hypothetical protein